MTLQETFITSNSRIPVVFIHGLWLNSTSWAPWIELFGRHGCWGVAPEWPGEPDTVEAVPAQLVRADPHAVIGAARADRYIAAGSP